MNMSATTPQPKKTTAVEQPTPEMDKKKELIETFATKAYDGDDSVFAEDAIVQPPYGTIAYFGPHIYFPLG